MYIWSLFCLFLLLVLESQAAAPENVVPLLSWSPDGAHKYFQEFSPLSTISSENIKSALLENAKGGSTVIFVFPTFSNEDIIKSGNSDFKYLKEQDAVLLPKVEDPTSVISYLKENSKVTEFDTKVDKTADKSNFIVVYLTEKKGSSRQQILMDNDQIIADVMKDLKPHMAILTAFKQHEEAPSVATAPFISRNLLAAKNEDTSLTINVTSNGTTVLYFTTKVVLIKYTENTKYVVDTTYAEKISNPTVVVEGNSVTIDFKIKDLSAKFGFSLNTKSFYWKMTEASAKAKGESFAFDISDMGATRGFSFSCGNLRSKRTKDQRLIFKNFQVQPFGVKHGGAFGFAESFDCQQFFTIATWMGLFIVLFFISILATGVVALYDIKTMDRFDDPKGKTISVPQTD